MFWCCPRECSLISLLTCRADADVMAKSIKLDHHVQEDPAVLMLGA